MGAMLGPLSSLGSQTPAPSPARYVIAVGSGKGGVGKSTVSLNLALALAEGGDAVGILDADFYGPNIPLMVGLKREKWAGDWTMAKGRGKPEELIPATERFGLKIMSAGFIIAEDQPLILDGQTVRFLIRQLVGQVGWGELEFLVVDLPPGTADVQQILIRELALSAALLVVTPQDVAHLDGKKAIQMFRQAKVPILGAVENMSGLVCPHCSGIIEVFSRVPEDRAIWAMGISRLGAIPLDPVVSRAGDEGTPVLVAYPASPQSDAFRALAARVKEKLQF